MPMGAPTKKTRENAKKILAMLRKGAFRKTAYLAVGMGHTVFAEWLNEDPDFALEVEAAEEFAIGKAVDRVLAHAKGGQKRVKTIREVDPGKLDEKGDPKLVSLRTEEYETEPNFAADRFYLSIKDPKRFGSKIDVTTGGEKLPTPTVLVGLDQIDDDELDRRLAEAEGRKAP